MGRHKAQRRRDNTRNRHQQRELMRRDETVREHVKETGDSHGCYEKLRYDSLAEAKRAADGSAAAYACQMGVYRCHVCHGYHVKAACASLDIDFGRMRNELRRWS